VYGILLRHRGHAGWWPGRSAFEVCVGAMLTQNTAWVNVEKALRALEAEGLMSFDAMYAVPARRLAPLIRSSGYFNLKARRLRAFLEFVHDRYGGRVERMSRADPLALRRELLAVSGIGPETADSIALYAAGLPLFVVDAYTRRVFERLGYLPPGLAYDEVQAFLMQRLPRDAALYNDYHAQIVLLAKDVCRKSRPRCQACPLARRCRRRGVSLTSQPRSS